MLEATSEVSKGTYALRFQPLGQIIYLTSSFWHLKPERLAGNPHFWNPHHSYISIPNIPIHDHQIPSTEVLLDWCMLFVGTCCTPSRITFHQMTHGCTVVDNTPVTWQTKTLLSRWRWPLMLGEVNTYPLLYSGSQAYHRQLVYVLMSCMESLVELPILWYTKTFLLKDLEVAPGVVNSLLEPVTALYCQINCFWLYSNSVKNYNVFLLPVVLT